MFRLTTTWAGMKGLWLLWLAFYVGKRESKYAVRSGCERLKGKAQERSSCVLISMLSQRKIKCYLFWVNKPTGRWINVSYFLSPCSHFLSKNGDGSAEPQYPQQRHYNIHLGEDEMLMLGQKICCLFDSNTDIWPSDGNIMISFDTATEMVKQM